MILAAARYEGDSTLCYSELVIGVLIRSPGWRLLPLRLLADQEAARRGGERIWGLHKELAEFAWTERPEPRNRKSYELVIRQGDRPVLDLWWMPRWLALPIRAPVPVAGDRPWTLEARARVQRAVHHLSARPPGTPGWLLAWHLSDLELVAPAPD
jgi:hypothetical protein